MRAIFRHESVSLDSGATLWRWALRTADGDVIDKSLATAPTVQEGRVLFMTTENVDGLEAVALVAPVAELEDGKRLTLYEVACSSCTVAR
jgi:hypothetical protein